ncbi:hypothetical protein RA307_10015 [Xanthobacteraceae bacterium Astr-EGSB]|uniref:hypothetical protein n=1 Tax=Astrobacterium formosum TaxID=3069710 RepID=UPI0027ADB5E6|nr:hypothetical protein [Xanthobacteraceae bacterium Astr-EGSB]
MAEGDLLFTEVCRFLRVAERTLDKWLAADARRPVDDRRFHFHAYRGQRRIWSKAAATSLQEAIERESLPGGVLAGGRTSSSAPAIGTRTAPFTPADVQSACDKVLNFPLRPRASATPKLPSTISSRRSKPKRAASVGAATPSP